MAFELQPRTREYHQLMQAFAQRWPGAFWQLNMWGAMGALALALEAAAIYAPGLLRYPWWGRMLALILPSALFATFLLRHWRRRVV
jgi:hypothetical protein